MRWFVIIMVVSLATTAMAKKEDAVRAARTSFKQGVAAFEQGRLSDALGSFQQAYAAKPSFRILFNIAQVQAEMGKFPAAIETFELYLVEGGDEIRQRRRAAVEKEIKRLISRVANVTVQGPEGAEIWIDGTKVGTLPLASSLRLAEGPHRLILTGGSEETCEKFFDAKGSDRLSVECEWLTVLPEGTIVRGQIDSGENLFSDDTSESSGGIAFVDKIAPKLAVGLGAATLTLGSLFALKTLRLNSDLNRSCPEGQCDPKWQNDANALPKWAGAADAMFVATSVLVAAAVVLFWAPWNGAKSESAIKIDRTTDADLRWDSSISEIHIGGEK